MPELAPWQWLLGAACTFFVGVAKTGVPGLGILAIPLMVLTVGDARQSAGWLLPLLCVADVFAVVYWRRHAASGRLFSLAPWVLAGMACGAAALSLSERYLRWLVGAIVLVMLALYLKRRFAPEKQLPPARSAPYGITAGFATTVANAAGPVMNLYLLSKRLPKEEFIATGAWFFFTINLTKVPIYVWHGLITAKSLTFNFVMLPAVLAGAVAGRWLVERIPQKLFEALVVLLTAVSTVLLFF
ncbi:MAG: sulfite exporter TauE/SafE family protein [Bryobacteraceae bacterium]|jgi:Predicted permeases|nr:sulfite exporter TauE/SafE family protein [Bryobacteraceae bacterium]